MEKTNNIDNEALLKLENYIFAHELKPELASDVMTDIIGVIIGVKPSTCIGFNRFDQEDKIVNDLPKMLNSLGLDCFYYFQSFIDNDMKREYNTFFVAKKQNKDKAAELKENFIKLWDITDNVDGTDQKAWRQVTRRIGCLLGYPRTAIEYFIRQSTKEKLSKGHLVRMGRNRYYAHSAKYEEEEYQAYDRKINAAIEKHLVKTLEIEKANKNKRWL